jgi:hypothetical protein
MAKLVGVPCAVGKSYRFLKFLKAQYWFSRGEGAMLSKSSPLTAQGLEQCLNSK